MELTGNEPSATGFEDLPVARSLRTSLLPYEPERIDLPSPEKVRPWTHDSCRSRRDTTPVSGSTRRIWSSSPPKAQVLPSGEKPRL